MIPYCRTHDVATTPVGGVADPGRIDAIVQAFDVDLTEDDITYLEELYVPHRLVGVMEQVQNSLK